MSRLQWCLTWVVIVELVAGGLLAVRRLAHPRPPLPDLSRCDAATAADLRQLAENCAGDSAEDWIRLGEALMAFGFLPESEACHRRAAQTDAGNAKAAYLWAFCLSRLGRTSDAIQQFHRAIELDYPQPESCWYFIGRNYLREEQSEAAREAFRRAEELPMARYELAKLLVRTGKASQAKPMLDQLLAQFPRSIKPNWLRAAADNYSGSFRANAVYRENADRANDRLPGPFDGESTRMHAAHQRYGASRRWNACTKLMQAGRLSEAAQCMRQTMDIQWRSSGLDGLAEIEIQQGNPQAAVRLLQEAIQRDGPSLHFIWRLGDAYREAGNREMAEQMWLRAAAMRSGPEMNDLHYQLAVLYQQSGNESAANRHFALVNYGAGVQAFWHHDLANARKALEQSVATTPDNAWAWFYLAETRRLLGERIAASAAYRQCLQLDPHHGRALTGLELLTRGEKVEESQSPRTGEANGRNVQESKKAE